MAKGTKEGKEAEATIEITSSKTTRTTNGIRIRRRYERRKHNPTAKQDSNTGTNTTTWITK